jgi:transposase
MHVEGLHGIGPSGAARLLADVGDIRRFADRDRFASWNGTAPLDASSGQQQRHRLSRAGNRRINRTVHIMAVVQLRHRTEGRAYFDAKKASAKTSMEAMRAVKRRLSNLIYARMVADQNDARWQAWEGSRGRLCNQRDRPDPGHRPFGQATSRTRHHPP